MESSEFRSATVSAFGVEENVCELNLKWSEAIVSCGGSVSYTVTVAPCLSGDCNDSTISGVDTEHSVAVNGSVELEYELTLRTETCNGRMMTNNSISVNLTGVADTLKVELLRSLTIFVAATSSGMEPSYFFIYNISTLMVEAVNVTLPSFCVRVC